MTGCDVLIFVEDPGAANFLAPLPAELQKQDRTSVLLANGLSVGHLRARQTDFVDITSFATTAADAIDKYCPRVIVGGTAENPHTLSLALFAEGKRRRIPTVGVVDMVVNAEHRFRGDQTGALAYAPDFIMVPDADTRDAFTRLGARPEQLIVTGYPQFDFVRAKALAMPVSASGGTTSKRTIVFVAEPESKLNPKLSTRNADYTLQGRGTSDFRTHIVLEEIIDALKKADVEANFIVRLHPKNSVADFETYRGEVQSFSEGGDPLNVLQEADLVIGMTTMLLQEAAWLGKQTLAVLPEPTDKQRLTSIASGLTPSVTDRDSLIAALRKFQQGTWTELNPGDFFVAGAAGRMADFIVGLASRNLHAT